MDEGSIVDNFNRKIDFSNTIIVLTGNIGAETETARSMGFVNTQSIENRKMITKKLCADNLSQN